MTKKTERLRSAGLLLYFLAMADWHSGHSDEAKQHLRLANQAAEKELAGNLSWSGQVILELLRKESESQIGIGPVE